MEMDGHFLWFGQLADLAVSKLGLDGLIPLAGYVYFPVVFMVDTGE